MSREHYDAHNPPKDWMKGAVKRPGAFHAKAAASGGLDRQGHIKESFIEKEKHSSDPRTRKQAVLAETFKKHRP